VRTNTVSGPAQPTPRSSGSAAPEGARAQDRLQRPLRVPRPARRRAHRRGRGGAQRGLHRRAPRAITNNLNFGNPKKPEVYHQLREAVYGMGDACRVLETPVTGGNVSLYNENPQGAIYPDADHRHGGRAGGCRARHADALHHAGDTIILLGENTDELARVEYLAWIHGWSPARRRRATGGGARLIDALLAAIRPGTCAPRTIVRRAAWPSRSPKRAWPTASTPSARMWTSRTGTTLPLRALLFGEAQGRVVLSTAHADAVLATALAHGVPARIIGKVSDASFGLSITVGAHAVMAPLATLMTAYHDALPRAMSRAAAEAVPNDPALAGGPS
jgi:phosphoribosylformylglycinamidine synthase subunit PurL